MATVSGLQASSIQKRAMLRRALETKDADAALRIAREDLQVVLDLANALIAEIKPQLAMAARRVAVEAAPEQPIVHLELARALILARKPDEAAAHVGQSPLSDEQRRQIFHDLTRRFLAEGRVKQATATLQAMAASMSLDATARSLGIHADVLGGGLEGAIERVQQSELPKAEQASILRQLAGEFEAQHQTGRMLACRRAAALLAAGDRVIVQEGVRAVMEREGFEAGAVLLTKSELEADEKLQVMRDLGGELMAGGKAELAMKCREEALRLGPDNRYVLYELVHALLLTGGSEATRSYVERNALSLDTYLSTLRDLGREFSESDHRALALSCRRMALALAPGAQTIVQEFVRTVFEFEGGEAALKELAACDLSASENVQILRDLGGEFLVTGAQDLALACREEALRRAPENRYVIYELLYAVVAIRGPDGLRAYVAEKALSTEVLMSVLEPLETELAAAGNTSLARDCARLLFALAPDESQRHARRLASGSTLSRDDWTAVMASAGMTADQVAAVVSVVEGPLCGNGAS